MPIKFATYGHGWKWLQVAIKWLYFSADSSAAQHDQTQRGYKERNQDWSGGGHVVSIVRTGQGPGSCLVIQTSSSVYYLHTSPYRIDPSTKAKMKKKKTLQHLG